MKKTGKNKVTKVLTIGYVKNSVNKQIVMNQKLEILEYSRTHRLSIDKWIESELSPARASVQKGTNQLLNFTEGDILVTTEFSGLGRSTSEILGIINQLLKKRTRIVFTKQNLDLDLVAQDRITSKTILRIFSVLAELERDIISSRTREVLSARKKHGASIGKAKGTIQNSIYDVRKEQILFLLSKKISVLDISRIIGIGKPRSLLIYLNKRKLRDKKN